MTTYTYICGHNLKKIEFGVMGVPVVPMQEICPVCWEKRNDGSEESEKNLVLLAKNYE